VHAAAFDERHGPDRERLGSAGRRAHDDALDLEPALQHDRETGDALPGCARAAGLELVGVVLVRDAQPVAPRGELVDGEGAVGPGLRHRDPGLADAAAEDEAHAVRRHALDLGPRDRASIHVDHAAGEHRAGLQHDRVELVGSARGQHDVVAIPRRETGRAHREAHLAGAGAAQIEATVLVRARLVPAHPRHALGVLDVERQPRDAEAVVRRGDDQGAGDGPTAHVLDQGAQARSRRHGGGLGLGLGGLEGNALVHRLGIVVLGPQQVDRLLDLGRGGSSAGRGHGAGLVDVAQGVPGPTDHGEQNENEQEGLNGSHADSWAGDPGERTDEGKLGDT
jgi:hypothetical protein